MVTVKIFECPFREQCYKAKVAAYEEPATLYADNKAYVAVMPVYCQAPFLESKNGNPICCIDIDMEKLTLDSYAAGIAGLKIHKPNVKEGLNIRTLLKKLGGIRHA